MGNIVENLNQINTIKEEIKTSIVNKGGDLTGKHFTDYPDAIDNLPSGGGKIGGVIMWNFLYEYVESHSGGSILKYINNKPAEEFLSVFHPFYIGTEEQESVYAIYTIPLSEFPVTITEYGWGSTTPESNIWESESTFKNINYVSLGNGESRLSLIDNNLLGYASLNILCLIKDTLILLSDKSYKKIQDITYEDELLVWNFDKGCFDSAKPFWIKKEEKTSHYAKITLENGKSILLTGDGDELHSLFDLDSNKFVHANELLEHNVMTLDGPSKVVSIERFEDDAEYYNIITDAHFNLYANDILASTSLNNLYPIKDMKFVYDKKNDNGYTFDDIDKSYVISLRLNENTTKSEKDLIAYANNLISSKK